ncbi:MAG: helix-turn-helix domain-containing protein [Polyangia bacterium]
MKDMATRSAWPGPASPRVIHLKRQLKKKLRRLVRAGTTENRMATRARVVLMRDEGVPIEVIARRMQINHGTARKWCDRFIDGGIDGLRDRPRSGRPRTLSLESSVSP